MLNEAQSPHFFCNLCDEEFDSPAAMMGHKKEAHKRDFPLADTPRDDAAPADLEISHPPNTKPELTPARLKCAVPGCPNPAVPRTGLCSKEHDKITRWAERRGLLSGPADALPVWQLYCDDRERWSKARRSKPDRAQQLTCRECGMAFDTASALGGHVSSAHSKKAREEVAAMPNELARPEENHKGFSLGTAVGVLSRTVHPGESHNGFLPDTFVGAPAETARPEENPRPAIDPLAPARNSLRASIAAVDAEVRQFQTDLATLDAADEVLVRILARPAETAHPDLRAALAVLTAARNFLRDRIAALDTKARQLRTDLATLDAADEVLVRVPA